jgi:hypothetical protein
MCPFADGFARDITAGWGSCPAGGMWYNSGGADEDYDVVTDCATIETTTANVSRRVTIANTIMAPHVLMSCTTDKVPAGGAQVCGVLLCYSDADNYYFARLYLDTDGTVTAHLRRRLAGTETTLGGAAVGSGYAAGQQWWIRCLVEGTTLHMRAWPGGAAEPSAWTVIAADSTFTSGRVGVRAISNADTSNLPVTYTVYGFDVASGTWPATNAPSITHGQYVHLLGAPFGGTVDHEWLTARLDLAVDDVFADAMRYVADGVSTAAATVGATARSATVTGLTNGTAYTFTVHGTTSTVGNGAESAASPPVTPGGGGSSTPVVPGVPAAVTATAGDTQALVSWTRPTAGTSGITGFVVAATPGAATATVGATARSATVAGLANGTAYTFTVHATSTVGDGPASTPTSAITPAAGGGVIPPGGALTWSPPSLSSPTSVYVTNSNRDLLLDPTKDYHIYMPASPLDCSGGLMIKGGRNVVLIGGEINLTQWRGNIPGNPNANRALLIQGAKAAGYTANSTARTVHIEGLLIRGLLWEGIDVDLTGDTNVTIQLENIRVGSPLVGSEATHHTNGLQAWDGPRHLRADRFTIAETGYQGWMMQPSSYGADSAWNIDMRRCDIHGGSTAAYLAWCVSTPAITCIDCYGVPGPGRTLSQVLHGIPGGFTQGYRPGGDASPNGVAGIGYASPGYAHGFTPPSDSYWQTGFPITHGYELATDGITYSDRRAVRAGIPPGATLTPSGSLTISAPGIYTDLDISGNLVIAANDVKLLRVRVCTGSFNALRCNGYTGFEAVDCEFSGGRASTVNAQGRFVRCLAFDGDDLLRPTGDQFEWVESVAWWPLRDSPSSHSDALQFTTNGGIITGVAIERSLLSSWKPETTDYMNAAIQTGDFKNRDGTIIGGAHGSVTDCFFDGGNYTVNAGGAANRPEVRMTYTGNRWGLKARYGPAQAVNTNVVWDNTNVFHQTGTTTYGRSVTAGQAVL